MTARKTSNKTELVNEVVENDSAYRHIGFSLPASWIYTRAQSLNHGSATHFRLQVVDSHRGSGVRGTPAVNSDTKVLSGFITKSVLASNLQLTTNGKPAEARTGSSGAVAVSHDTETDNPIYR